MLCDLLGDLGRGIGTPFELILTLNIPESEDFLQSLAHPQVTYQVIRNSAPKGFGANHNQAFQQCKSPFFLVLNPDARLTGQNLQLGLDLLQSSPSSGVYGAKVVDAHGTTQATARTYPTLQSIVRRFFNRRRHELVAQQAPRNPDWIAGVFMLFREDAYRAVQGFDERYFMYVEDVDICKRLRLHGYEVLYDDTVIVVHDGQHASYRNPQHLLWHLKGLLRFTLLHSRRSSS